MLTHVRETVSINNNRWNRLVSTDFLLTNLSSENHPVNIVPRADWHRSMIIDLDSDGSVKFENGADEVWPMIYITSSSTTTKRCQSWFQQEPALHPVLWNGSCMFCYVFIFITLKNKPW